MDASNHDVAKKYAFVIAHQAVRENTILENLHSGITPTSKTGDYSDVRVVTPYGDIQWHHLSRISDDEMKALMIGIVDNVYSIMRLLFDEDPALTVAEMIARLGTSESDQPAEIPHLLEVYRKFFAASQSSKSSAQ